MFCPNCGKSVNDKLKYCNSCGQRLAKDEDRAGTPDKMFDKILRTLFFIVIFGLGVLVALVAVMLDKNVKAEIVATIVVTYLAAIFGICFLLARQVPKLIDARLKAWNDSAEVQTQPQLAPQTTAQLDEYREPVMSVTDHTTKTLDKVPLERS